jgi:hypothetical protein
MTDEAKAAETLLNKAKDEWNKSADECNQWGTLGWDEKALIFVNAVKASQPVDCRGCSYFQDDIWCGLPMQGCTNGDKFQELPKVMLYKQEPNLSNGVKA